MTFSRVPDARTIAAAALAGAIWLAPPGLPPALAGPYANAGIAHDDPSIAAWATGYANLVRGPVNISQSGSAPASFGSGDLTLGVPGGIYDVASLGDGGQITVTFATPITNKAGGDFAVFENAFHSPLPSSATVFGELAFVEVSSDGVNFLRFPSDSLTPAVTQLGTFGVIDSTNIHNLAGQFPPYEGTPFDLDDLAALAVGYPIDLHRITHVRVIDVVGSINPLYASYDSQGRIINDPFTTPFPECGFDLDAVGVMHQWPPSSWGDATVDGAVNLDDLSLLASRWQQTGVWATGDFNGDGLVNLDDLSLLASNWNLGTAGQGVNFADALAAVGLAGQGVPEPLAGLITLVGAGATLAGRRRARSMR